MTNNTAVANKKPAAPTLHNMLNNNTVKQRFEYILGKKSAGFISSLLSLTNANPKLQECNPQTVLSAAMTAATLDLPINPNLGFAYIVPYRNKGVMQAQYQMGYKGYIQLAMRTGQYKTVNVCPVYEGQIQEIDCFTGEIIRGEKASDTIVGYMAYFKLINGFEKYLYMTVAELEAHGRKYSKAYGNLWVSNFSAMASKTVLKLLISKYGIMSIEMMGMEKALAADQAVINPDGSYNYIDNKTHDEPIDAIAATIEDEPQEEPAPEPVPVEVDPETGEILPPEHVETKI